MMTTMMMLMSAQSQQNNPLQQLLNILLQDKLQKQTPESPVKLQEKGPIKQPIIILSPKNNNPSVARKKNPIQLYSDSESVSTVVEVNKHKP
jgi:hypothetical protein